MAVAIKIEMLFLRMVCRFYLPSMKSRLSRNSWKEGTLRWSVTTHSLIERKLKHRQIFLPTDYISVIEESRKNPIPLEVSYLTHNFFLNYNDSKKWRYSSIRPGKSKGDLKVTDLRALKYLPNGEIFYKVAHDQKYELLPQRKNTVNYDLPYDQLYSNRLKISIKKWKDLQEMKSVLPADVHYFHDMIPHQDSSITRDGQNTQDEENNNCARLSQSKGNNKKQKQKAKI